MATDLGAQIIDFSSHLNRQKQRQRPAQLAPATLGPFMYCVLPLPVLCFQPVFYFSLMPLVPLEQSR